MIEVTYTISHPAGPDEEATWALTRPEAEQLCNELIAALGWGWPEEEPAPEAMPPVPPPGGPLNGGGAVEAPDAVERRLAAAQAMAESAAARGEIPGHTPSGGSFGMLPG